jgi:hypothetical protein
MILRGLDEVRYFFATLHLLALAKVCFGLEVIGLTGQAMKCGKIFAKWPCTCEANHSLRSCKILQRLNTRWEVNLSSRTRNTRYERKF